MTYFIQVHEWPFLAACAFLLGATFAALFLYSLILFNAVALNARARVAEADRVEEKLLAQVERQRNAILAIAKVADGDDDEGEETMESLGGSLATVSALAWNAVEEGD